MNLGNEMNTSSPKPTDTHIQNHSQALTSGTLYKIRPVTMIGALLNNLRTDRPWMEGLPLWVGRISSWEL